MKLEETFHSSFYKTYHKASILIFLLLTVIPHIVMMIMGLQIDLVPVKIVVISFFLIVYFCIDRFNAIGINIASRLNVFLMFVIATWLGFSVVVEADYPSNAVLFLISISILYCTYSISSMRMHVIYSIYSTLSVSIGFFIKYGTIKETIPFSIILAIFLFLSGILLKIRINISDEMYRLMAADEKRSISLIAYTERLERNEFLMSNMFKNIPYQLAILDIKGKYIKANLHCFPNQELVNYMIDKTDMDYCNYLGLNYKIGVTRLETIDMVIENKEMTIIKEKIRFSNGEISLYERTYVPILNKAGNVINILMMGKDITEDVAIRESLKNAEVDPVSSTYTRTYIESFIKNKIKYSDPFTIVLIRVNNLKKVNESFGYDYGDKVVKIIGEFLKEFIAENDAVGRLTGNEFLVCFYKLQTMEEINTIINELMSKFNDIIKPYKEYTNITLSIGTSTFEKDGNGFSFLLKYADMALNSIKNKEITSYRCYIGEKNGN